MKGFFPEGCGEQSGDETNCFTSCALNQFLTVKPVVKRSCVVERKSHVCSSKPRSASKLVGRHTKTLDVAEAGLRSAKRGGSRRGSGWR